jgi:hypothetical protein
MMNMTAVETCTDNTDDLDCFELMDLVKTIRKKVSFKERHWGILFIRAINFRQLHC